MAYEVVFAEDAELDFKAILRFLIESHVDFGETEKSAFAASVRRTESIRKDVMSLARAPYRGTLHEDLLPGLRHVTLDRAIVYFQLDEAGNTVLVLAVFFGGQNHHERILARLREKQK